ncbi:MAG: 16S rRNA (cytidine(1402)-2'-O)-methyltransferase [Candidatus Aminicenantes bacterium]|nr:16S rRNA (cytidine(1402)-2'-O)-methyltransferase [Candidatus Aminicenantes bacterium]
MRDVKTEPASRGKLYIVATPIGNLEDLSFRALRILKEAEAIACEDTRQTLKLLNKYGLKKRLISYFQPKEGQKIPQIVEILMQGRDVALVSDAGTPGISDPGYPLIQEAIQRGIVVTPIPGPSAVTTALSAAGLPSHRFLFLGFPSPKKEAARKLLLSLKDEKATLVFFLPVRKMAFFIRIVLDTLGDRRVVIARELTKIHEEFIRGTAEDIINHWAEKNWKGEATLLIEGLGKK